MCSCVECEVTLYAEIISLMTWFSLCLFFSSCFEWVCCFRGSMCAHPKCSLIVIPARSYSIYDETFERTIAMRKQVYQFDCVLAFFCAHILWIEISITHWNVTRNCLGSFSRQSLTRSQNDWQKWHVKVKWTNDMTYVNLGTFQHTLKPFTSFDFNTEL